MDVPGMHMRFHDEGWMNLLAKPVVFLGLPAVWVIAVYALVHYMTDKPSVKVKQFMQIYNIVQILVCGYMTWGLYPVVTIQDSFPYVNLFGVNTEFDKAGEWFVFVHYLSKFLDWFDTLWIVLNKKRAQLSFLHVYHHATIVPVWGMLLHAGVGSGTVRYGALVNSITHVIMYGHYFWTSLGLRNPFKKYITMWQITQFYSCIVHAFIVFFFEQGDSKKYAWIQVLYQMTMVYLFSWKMAYVPDCVPNLSVEKDEKPITCMEFISSCNPQDADETAKENETKAVGQVDAKKAN